MRLLLTAATLLLTVAQVAAQRDPLTVNVRTTIVDVRPDAGLEPGQLAALPPTATLENLGVVEARIVGNASLSPSATLSHFFPLQRTLDGRTYSSGVSLRHGPTSAAVRVDHSLPLDGKEARLGLRVEPAASVVERPSFTVGAIDHTLGDAPRLIVVNGFSNAASTTAASLLIEVHVVAIPSGSPAWPALSDPAVMGLDSVENVLARSGVEGTPRRTVFSHWEGRALSITSTTTPEPATVSGELRLSLTPRPNGGWEYEVTVRDTWPGAASPATATLQWQGNASLEKGLFFAQYRSASEVNWTAPPSGEAPSYLLLMRAR